MLAKRFVNLNPDDYIGKTIILDVDGTLVADRASEMDVATESTLKRLANLSLVYLCSNARTKERLRIFAECTGAQYIGSRYKKPNMRVLEEVPQRLLADAVVIGDKFLTDGILASRLKAPFVKVERLHFRHERPSVHLSYAFDSTVGRAVCFMHRLFV